MNSKAKLASNVVSITDKQPSRKQLNKRVERQLQKVFDKAGSTWNGSTAASGGATGCPKKPLRHWAEEAETECERNPSNDDAFIKTTAVRAAMDLEKAGLLPAECGHRWNIPLSLVYEGYRAALKKMAGFDPSKGTRKQFVYKTARGTIQNLAWALYGPTGKRKHTKDQALPKLVGFSVDIPEHRWGLDHGNAGYQVKPRNGDDNDDEGDAPCANVT